MKRLGHEPNSSARPASAAIARSGLLLAAALALVGYGPFRAAPTASRSAQRVSDHHASSAPPASEAPASNHHADADDDDDDRDEPAHAVTAANAAGHTHAPHCRRQQPLPFLVRSNYLHHRTEFAHAVRYRTEHYGYFDGFGEHAWNAHPPRFYARRTTFMGLPVTINERVIPALQCAEAEIQRTCGAHPYRPRALAGIRFHNTYHSGEITNHAYGIAIDIDPDRNTCCHCVGRWAEHPLCRRQTHSIFERMSMPECWVTAFERYGFYWLGHDTLQDTMHFEFLADPERIVRSL